MDRKILFFDIDGTLIGKSMTLMPKTMEAIQQAKDRGYLVYICTGRALTSVYPSIRELCFDGYITSAGSIIYVGQEAVYEHYLDKKLVESCLHLFGDQGIYFTLETKHGLYQTKGVEKFFEEMQEKLDNPNQELMRMKEVKRHRSHVLDFSMYNFDIPVTKITFVCRDKEKFERIRPYFTDNFNIVLFSEDDKQYCNGELIFKDCTKGHALKYICNYHGIDIKNSIAFGDSMNDYEMLEAAGTSVVSKAATDTLKAFGDYFFDDPDRDGIYHVMKEMKLI